MSDQKEYEVKVLDFDVEQVMRVLRESGAEEKDEVFQRRWVFDIESENIEFIRLRTDGKTAKLSYKMKILGNTAVGNTEEIETEVSDFDKTAEILKRVPFKDIFYQENKRKVFIYNGIEFSIDHWPKIQPVLEIESSSEEKVSEGLELLNLKDKSAGDLDVKEMYKRNGIDLHSIKVLKFDL